MLLAFTSQLDLNIDAWAGGAGTPLDGFIRLLFAGAMGAVIGLERETRGREAGMRTCMLVCIGSALAMLVSEQMAIHPWHAITPNQGVNINVDPARIAYSVMAGIGFIGAGVVLHEKGAIRGLTTAAALWCMAAVGLTSGFGMYTLAMSATALILVILSVLWLIERALPKVHYRTMTIRTTWKPDAVHAVVEKLKSAGLHVDDTYFDRDERDPKCVNIQLSISYVRRDTYYAFMRKIESDPDCDLMAAREV
jgi:putative Mg2+ transporter-C (MgtC) family protein